MAVKVGNSWVSETALTYAKAKSGSGTSVSLKALSDRYPGVNFTTNTQNFSQKGTNNIQIAPNILTQMQNDPDKRVEYEALIYDCAQLVYSGKMSQGGMGYHIKAAGTVINADGSVGGWSIAEDEEGGQTRNSTKLDKDKKDTWADKILEKQKAKRVKARKEAAARLQEQMNGPKMKSYADNLFLSQAGMDSYNQLSPVSYQDYVNRFESEVSEVYEKEDHADAVKSDSFDQHVNRMASAYDKMKNSIEEKYAKEDHKTEYYIAESGKIEELTKEKELDMLNRAYESHSTLMAASTEIWQGLQDFTPTVQYSKGGSGQTVSDQSTSAKTNGAVKSAAYQAFMSAISPDNRKLSQQYSGNWKELRFNLNVSGTDRKMLNSIWDHYSTQETFDAYVPAKKRESKT